MHHFLFCFSHLSLLTSLTSSTCNIPSPFLSFPSEPQPTFPSLTLSTDLGTLHLGLSWGPGYPDETPSIPPRTYPSPLLILTPTSFPGLGPSKHSFGTIIPGHQNHGTPRGHCRPVLEAQGKGRVRARSQTDSWGARQALTLSPPPRLSLSLNFNMSRTSRSMGSHELFTSSLLLSWDWGGHCQRASGGAL